ncbi:hypothetical protein LV779_02250 [Streptomyces thinghirensis]|nr:hypothetical protein [Streptomyces thinghirensis]
MDRARSITRLFQEVVFGGGRALRRRAHPAVVLHAPHQAPADALGRVPAAAASVMALSVLLRLTPGVALFDTPEVWPHRLRISSAHPGQRRQTSLDQRDRRRGDPAAAGALLITVGWARQTRPGVPVLTDPRHGPTPDLRRHVACALVGTMLAPVAITGHHRASARVAPGAVRRPPATRSPSSRRTTRWPRRRTGSSALQDPDIVGQPQCRGTGPAPSTHCWERPEEVAERLSTSDFPALRRRLTST